MLLPTIVQLHLCAGRQEQQDEDIPEYYPCWCISGRLRSQNLLHRWKTPEVWRVRTAGVILFCCFAVGGRHVFLPSRCLVMSIMSSCSTGNNSSSFQKGLTIFYLPDVHMFSRACPSCYRRELCACPSILVITGTTMLFTGIKAQSGDVFTRVTALPERFITSVNKRNCVCTSTWSDQLVSKLIAAKMVNIQQVIIRSWFSALMDVQILQIG